MSEALLPEIQRRIGAGKMIKKPRSQSWFRVVDTGICFTVGNRGNEKRIKVSELREMLTQINASGEADRRWFARAMPKRARQDPCNFTAMGSLLQELGYASYDETKGVYRRST